MNLGQQGSEATGDLRLVPSAAWLVAWGSAGVACAFTLAAMMSIGIFLLPFVAFGTFLLHRKRRVPGFGWAMMSGVGFIPLLIAFLNRDGPGNVCRTFRDGGQSCSEQWSPWPFLAVALAIIVSGALLCRQARQAAT